MKKKPKPHGGKRTGAGRKATGRTSSSRSITMKNKHWEMIDSSKGNMTPGQYITVKIFGEND